MTEASPSRRDVNKRAIERLSGLALFNSKFYLRDNPDVAGAGLDPLVHAVSYGIRENRPVLSDLAIARAYGETTERWINKPCPLPSPPFRIRATVFVHSLSQDAYRELADSLAADLEAVGFDVARQNEKANHRDDHGIALFVAPHDFFVLGRGPLWRDPEVLGEGFVMLDEPVGSPVWQQSLAVVLEAKGVIETATIGAKIWAEAGIPTFHCEMHAAIRGRWLEPTDLDHSLLRAMPAGATDIDGDPLRSDRPVDLLFFDQESARRKAALGRLSATLSRHRCFIYCRQLFSSQAEERQHSAAHWRISGHLSSRSQLTLNLAASSLPCLDRRRVVAQAMTGGSVVVSDVRFVEPGLEAGVHYLFEEKRHLGGLVDWLLSDPDGQATLGRTRDRAFDRLADRNGNARRLEGLRDFLLHEPYERDRSA